MATRLPPRRCNLLLAVLACGVALASSAVPACGGSTGETADADVDAAAQGDAPPVDPPRPKTTVECFGDLAGPVPGPNYEQFQPKMGTHCAGTQAQRIEGVEKLVFLGDSITVGTPPTPRGEYYSSRVEAEVRAKFGADIEVASCAKWGASTDDFIRRSDAASSAGQIAECFPSGVEQKKTLIVMTMGGNDLKGWITKKMDLAAAKQAATEAARRHGEALAWLKSNDHFPRGSYVILANVYDFTDTTSDISACPTAAAYAPGVGVWEPGPLVLKHFDEELMRHAVATGSDMIFLLESFCGHGFRRDDPALQCYRGPNAEAWFDFTCIHPTPAGHEQIANLVLTVIAGE